MYFLGVGIRKYYDVTLLFVPPSKCEATVCLVIHLHIPTALKINRHPHIANCQNAEFDISYIFVQSSIWSSVVYFLLGMI